LPPHIMMYRPASSVCACIVRPHVTASVEGDARRAAEENERGEERARREQRQEGQGERNDKKGKERATTRQDTRETNGETRPHKPRQDTRRQDTPDLPDARPHTTAGRASEQASKATPGPAEITLCCANGRGEGEGGAGGGDGLGVNYCLETTCHQWRSCHSTSARSTSGWALQGGTWRSMEHVALRKTRTTQPMTLRCRHHDAATKHAALCQRSAPRKTAKNAALWPCDAHVASKSRARC